MICWYSAKVLPGGTVGRAVDPGPTGCVVGVVGSVGVGAGSVSGAGVVIGGSGAGGADSGGGSVSRGNCVGFGGGVVVGGGDDEVGSPPWTVKIAVVPPHSLVLVTVCPPGSASGTVKVSEILPSSSAVPFTSGFVLSHDSATDPDPQ